jgi:hypothetical protein
MRNSLGSVSSNEMIAKRIKKSLAGDYKEYFQKTIQSIAPDVMYGGANDGITVSEYSRKTIQSIVPDVMYAGFYDTVTKSGLKPHVVHTNGLYDEVTKKWIPSNSTSYEVEWKKHTSPKPKPKKITNLQEAQEELRSKYEVEINDEDEQLSLDTVTTQKSNYKKECPSYAPYLCTQKSKHLVGICRKNPGDCNATNMGTSTKGKHYSGPDEVYYSKSLKEKVHIPEVNTFSDYERKRPAVSFNIR